MGVADILQTLAVSPGLSGQLFSKSTLNKIMALRIFDSQIPIEVDGGIIPSVARACQNAGATKLVVGSYLYSNDTSFSEALSSFSKDHDA